MPPIRICHPHALDFSAARARVDRLAADLARQHGAECRWRGDRLAIRRSGFDGCIEVREGEVAVSAELGLMLRPLRGRLESEIEALLARHFPTA